MEESLPELDLKNIPQHVAIIMDGNGRWAKQKGGLRIFGHQSGVESVRDAVETAAKLGIKFLTLYAFSTENWQRPQFEVNALMNILASSLQKELPLMQKNNIKLNMIGNMLDLPKKCQTKLNQVMEATQSNSGTVLTLALSYGSRNDIIEAIKKISHQVSEGSLKETEINIDVVKNALSTHNIPDPELLIRTSGEFRISNFLLWEIAYSEIYITPILWPDFRKKDLYLALADYQKRERRFGKTGEQIKTGK